VTKVQFYKLHQWSGILESNIVSKNYKAINITIWFFDGLENAI
jgi:hypothetical protein